MAELLQSSVSTIRRRAVAILLGTAVTIALFTSIHVALAASYTSGSISLSTPAINATGATYTVTLGGVTTTPIACIQVQFTTVIGTTAKPSGMNVTSAAFSPTSNYVPTPGSWTVTNNNTTGIVQLTNGTGETPASATGRTIVLSGITNGSTAGVSYYAQVNTFNNTDCTSSAVDNGTLPFAFSDSVVVTATTNPTLNFSVGSTSCALGTLSKVAPTTCTHTITAGTNAVGGYTISYLAAPTLTSSGTGNPTIAANATPLTSSPGSPQFGFNLRDNATPNVGADPSGGSGTPSTNYNTADSFTFETGGANIATATGTTDDTTFTATYLANISSSTAAGSYSTAVTYNILANY